MENKYISEIKEDYNSGMYRTKMEYPKNLIYKEGYVFDEEKSVRWNKEEYLKLKDENEIYRKSYKDAESVLRNELEESIINAICYEFELNRNQAELIYSYAYRNNHSHFYEIFYVIEEFCSLYVDLKSKE